MWSFFWTALWATLFNCHDQGKSVSEINWRDDVRGEHRDRDAVAHTIRDDVTLEENEEYSNIFREMVPLLRDWLLLSLDEMTRSWSRELLDVRKKGSAPADLLMLFHKYRGVLDFVGILSKSGLLSNN
jgi:hypothetical protein